MDCVFVSIEKICLENRILYCLVSRRLFYCTRLFLASDALDASQAGCLKAIWLTGKRSLKRIRLATSRTSRASKVMESYRNLGMPIRRKEPRSIDNPKDSLRCSIEITPFWKFQIRDQKGRTSPALFKLAVYSIKSQDRLICDCRSLSSVVRRKQRTCAFGKISIRTYNQIT